MGGEWVETTIGDICSIEAKLVDPRHNDVADLPHLGIDRIVSAAGRILPLSTAKVDGVISGKYQFGPTDVVYSKIRPELKKAAYPQFPGLASADAYPLRCNERCLPQFLLLILLSDDFTEAAVAKSSRTKMPKINRAELFSIKVKVPPLAVQRRIVDLVAHLDEHLVNLRVELDVAGRLLVRLRDQLLAAEAGWSRVSLGDLTTKIGSGATPRGGEGSYVGHGTALIRSQNVHDMRFGRAGLAHISDEQAARLDGVTVQEDDILLNITGASVNRLCIVPREVLPARVNQHVAIIRARREVVSAWFLAHLLRRSDVKARLDAISGAGTTRQAITKAAIEKFTLEVPALEVQRPLADVLQSHCRLIEDLAAEAAHLERLRGAVLGGMLDGRTQIPASYDSLLAEVS